MGVHALIDNMVSFISGDVGLAPAFKEPEESMSTSPQATILAMEQQQSRAEVTFHPSTSSSHYFCCCLSVSIQWYHTFSTGSNTNIPIYTPHDFLIQVTVI